MKKVFLGLGSNLGNKYMNLSHCCELIDDLSNVKIINSSFIYKSVPLYYKNQSSFLNMVIEISTTLLPEELLLKIKNIESSLGRDINNGHNLPRPIDIDILCFGNLKIFTKDLTIPHPLIFERKFVLQPWSDIVEDFILVGMNKSIKYLLKNTPDQTDVTLTEFSIGSLY